MRAETAPHSASRAFAPVRQLRRGDVSIERRFDRAATSNAFWRGGSGRSYHATIERFQVCKAPVRAAYVLVRRDADGRAQAMFVGLAISRAPSANLARIRQLGALLDAKEVHCIDLTHCVSSLAARRIVRDLRAALN